MELLYKLEKIVFNWFKNIPGLPEGARKWLADNIWWIVIIGTVLTIISILGSLAALSTRISLQGTIAASYYISTVNSTWLTIADIVAIVFMILEVILLILAIQPLKEKQKKGWVLLFATWLLGGVALVVNALLGLNVLHFIVAILFGAIWLAISGYFLFEIHSQFAHVERSRGVKKSK
jgi:hypothetical protein